jgi:translation initiation factor IF-1
MTDKKEFILLDARIESVINHHVFRAVLANGHRIVAFTTRNGVAPEVCRIGHFVEVEVSPFDMAKGRIIKVLEENHESTAVG